MKYKAIGWMLILCLLLAGCSRSEGQGSASEPREEATESSETAESTETAESVDLSAMDFTFSDRDLSGSYDAGTAAAVSADGKITAAGTYLLTGSRTETLVIAAGENDKVQLVLDNADLLCADGPAIYIQSADKVFLTLAEGSVNTLSDGSSYTLTDGDTTLDAALFSKADLTINGAGTLNITGNYKHGIVSKDDLVIAAGVLNVTAEKVGLNGKDCVKINDSSITIQAGSDGIRSDNTEDAERGFVYAKGGSLTITAWNDGIQAETALLAEDAALAITAGGGSGSGGLSSSEESYKGLKAGSTLLFTGGSAEIDSRDDCIHSNDTVQITGGGMNSGGMNPGGMNPGGGRNNAPR